MYESELYDLFIEELERIYSVVGEAEVYSVLFLRYQLTHFSIPDRLSLAHFFLDELNLDEDCSYKGVRLNLINVVYPILFNLAFRYSLKHDEGELGLLYNEISRVSRFRAKRFQDLKEHSVFIRYYSLQELKHRFKSPQNAPRTIPLIDYSLSHNLFKRTLEEELDSEIHSLRIDSCHAGMISEEDLEKFMAKNLSLIEEGMRFLDRQVILDEGRVDILAMDKDGVHTVIELKVEEDKEIAWQCLYYPPQIRERFRVDKVRMITLCPEYKPRLIKALEKISGVEMMEFRVHSDMGKIKWVEVGKKL